MSFSSNGTAEDSNDDSNGERDIMMTEIDSTEDTNSNAFAEDSNDSTENDSTEDTNSNAIVEDSNDSAFGEWDFMITDNDSSEDTNSNATVEDSEATPSSPGGDSDDGFSNNAWDDSEGSSSDASARLPLCETTKHMHQANISNRLSLGSLVERLEDSNVTEQTLVQYCLFRHASPGKEPSSRRFPPGSMARKVEKAVGHIKTIDWGVRGGKFRRNKMWDIVKQATLAPLGLSVRSGHILTFRKKKAKTPSKIAYSVLVGGEDVNPALRMGTAMLEEAQTWGLNLPQDGHQEPGTCPRGKTYMGGTRWKLPLENQDTFMGGGVSLLAATMDGRGISGNAKSTTVGLLCPSTGAGGPFALRSYQPMAEVAIHENNDAVRHGLRASMLPKAMEEVYAWEQQTAQCPIHIPGPPLRLCAKCGQAHPPQP